MRRLDARPWEVKMKAISIRQPWAWAFLHGKDVENRNWKGLPKYRGPILIHASKTFDHDGYAWLWENRRLLDIPWQSIPDQQDFISLNLNGFGTGGVVAKGQLIDAVREIESPWFFGRIGLVIKDVVPVDFIPFRGRLGIFEVPI